MADWQRTLNLLPEWTQAQNEEITPQQMAAVISRRMLALRPLDDVGLDMQREDIAERFGDFSRDDEADVDEFDYLMNELYDWGDVKLSGGFFDAKKVCWIKTF